MRILIAEDNLMYRTVLADTLTDWGYEVAAVGDGLAACDALTAKGAPKLALLDWVMPGLDGPAVCRRLRAAAAVEPPYLILLTGRDAPGDLVAGLDSGANDYVTKPFHREELRARLEVGRRVVELQGSLASRVRELEEALAQVRQLRGLLPICSYCKSIRDDQNYWQQVEGYIARHADVQFSHGICPDCWQAEIRPQLARAGVAAPAEA